MRIRRIQSGNSSAFIILFGFVFAVVGLLVGAFVGQTTTLDCRRLESVAVDCRLQRDLLGYPVSERAIGDLDRAWVDVSTDSEGGEVYGVMLEGAAGQTPLSGFYSSSRRSKEEAATTINQFLSNPSQPTLQLEQSERWVFVLAGFFFLTGVLFMTIGLLRAVLGVARRLSIGRAV